MIRFIAAILLATAALVGAPIAQAADVCDEFGGRVEQDGLCRVEVNNSQYVLDMSFPVDFPEQDAVTKFLTDTKAGFLEAVRAPDARNLPYGLDIKAVLDASDTTKTATFEVYQNVGGAHPNTWYKSFNYDVARQRAITFDDLFAPGVKPLDTIFPIVQQELATRIGHPDPVFPSEGMDSANYQNFAITPVELIFFFDRGALMAGAGGAQVVRIPRSELPPLAV